VYHLNKWVLSLDLNSCSVVVVLIARGREFLSLWAKTEKDLPPIDEILKKNLGS